MIYPGKYDESYGRCEVHEKFTPEMLIEIRQQYNIPKGGKDAAILVHWNVPRKCSGKPISTAVPLKWENTFGNIGTETCISGDRM